MKRIFATGSIAALAMIGFAGTANAAPSDFGQLHKTINTEGFAGYNTVGELVQDLRSNPDFKNGGQAKKSFK